MPGNGVGGAVVAVGDSVSTESLGDAAKAHEAIEGRRTVAKTLLLTD